MMRWLIGLVLLTILGCDSARDKTLPIAGYKEVKEVNGKIDTIYHTIGDYSFVNQDSVMISPQTFNDKIYVADFFFTSCPSICPKMKKQMLRVYEEFYNTPDLLLLSHTIDPRHDTVAVLRKYAELMEVESSKWHFVTGDQDEIYELAEKSYFAPAGEDGEAPGGYIHNGAFVLVDKEKRIRGVYDGTDELAVNRLIRDIPVLLKEYEK
jgi:protein SCO1/2